MLAAAAAHRALARNARALRVPAVLTVSDGTAVQQPPPAASAYHSRIGLGPVVRQEVHRPRLAWSAAAAFDRLLSERPRSLNGGLFPFGPLHRRLAKWSVGQHPESVSIAVQQSVAGVTRFGLHPLL